MNNAFHFSRQWTPPHILETDRLTCFSERVLVLKAPQEVCGPKRGWPPIGGGWVLLQGTVVGGPESKNSKFN